MDLAAPLSHPLDNPSTQENSRFPSLAHTREAIESSFSDGALRVRKTSAGFDDSDVLAAIDVIERAENWVDDGSLKYLVFDFDHSSKPFIDQVPKSLPMKGANFAVMLHAHANLVLRVPVISVAIVRSRMAGSDLEMALSCGVIFAEEGAQFVLPHRGKAEGSLFTFLDRKLGPKADEIDGGVTLTAAEMKDLRLVREIFPAGGGAEGGEKWMHQALRRHNAAYLIHRAQRVVAPVRWAEVSEAQEA